MNFNLKLKKIRTFRKMTQKELSEKIGLTDQHRIVQYEKGVRVPKKDLVDKMATALDVNPYTLYDTAGRDASEMMELLFWLDEFNPSALHLFLPRKFPGEKCNEVADTSVYYHDNDSWPAHAPVCMWFNYGVLNDFLKEFIARICNYTNFFAFSFNIFFFQTSIKRLFPNSIFTSIWILLSNYFAANLNICT